MELAKADARPLVAGQVSGPLLITKGGIIGILAEGGVHLKDWGNATSGEVDQVRWERHGNSKGGADQAGGRKECRPELDRRIFCSGTLGYFMGVRDHAGVSAVIEDLGGIGVAGQKSRWVGTARR